jgi:trehalose-6-phosphate synthase
MRLKFEHFKATTWAFQDEMYNRMLQMQEDERNARLKEILENHSAKVIQKHWRRFLKQRKREQAKQKGAAAKKK